MVKRKISQVARAVQVALQLYPELKDNDNRLVANIWNGELMALDLNPKEMSAFQLLRFYADGKITCSDTITRARRKLQEEFPQLRGVNYAVRHKHQRNIVDDILTFRTS